MKKILCAPGNYIQQPDAFGTLADYYAMAGAQGAYLIIDPFIDKEYHDLIISSFEDEGATYRLERFGGECSMTEIDRHRGQIGSADAVIGIGGGKTLDTAKAVAHFTGLPAIICPTAASSDAPCSRLSVVYTDDGQFDHYLPLPKNPDLVIMDTTIIANAPVRFFISGLGDAYATYFEAEACRQSNAITMAGGHATNAALALAKLCHDLLVSDGPQAVAAVGVRTCTPAVENVIEANTLLSGLGFESSGLAAAHAIHNGLTALPGTHAYLHGEKVAYGTLAQFVLENRPQSDLFEAYGFFRQVGLPTTLAEIGVADATDDDLLRVGELACDKDDTMENMPFKVTPRDVAGALRAANELNTVI